MNREFKGNMTKKHKKSPSDEGLVLRFCHGSAYIFCRCRTSKDHFFPCLVISFKSVLFYAVSILTQWKENYQSESLRKIE